MFQRFPEEDVSRLGW